MKPKPPKRRIYVTTYDDGTPSGASALLSDVREWAANGDNGPYVYVLEPPKTAKKRSAPR